MNKPKIVVPEINFDSEIFEEARRLLDLNIREILHKVYNGEFAGGDISLKISLSLIDDYTILPTDDPITGETTETTYEYRRPVIDSTVSRTLKKVSKDKTSYSPAVEIKEVDGEFVLQELPKAQITIDDFEF